MAQEAPPPVPPFGPQPGAQAGVPIPLSVRKKKWSTSTPSPAVEVLNDIDTHLPSASLQIPALEESCEAVEAREIMWFKTKDRWQSSHALQEL